MGAFMAVTAFLSMWISNTATTAMMLPIAVATVKTITGEGAEEDTSTSQNSDPEADQVSLNYSKKVDERILMRICNRTHFLQWPTAGRLDHPRYIVSTSCYMYLYVFNLCLSYNCFLMKKWIKKFCKQYDREFPSAIPIAIPICITILIWSQSLFI